MSNPLYNLGISLVAMQGMCLISFSQSLSQTISSTVARKIPFDDPDVLNYVRIGYVASQVIILGVYYLTSLRVCSFSSIMSNSRADVYLQIKAKNDQTVLKYGKYSLCHEMNSSDPHDVVEPANPMVIIVKAPTANQTDVVM